MTVSHAAADSYQAESSKESAYQEIEMDGRVYVFASSARKAEFEKSGELGKGIIKV
jgi:YHS domain-containing protein